MYASFIIVSLAFSALYCSCDAFSSSRMHERRTQPPPSLSSDATTPFSTRLGMGGRTNNQRREDRKRYQEGNSMLDFIDEPKAHRETVGDLESICEKPEDDDLADLVRCIVRSADGRKAENIVAMRVSKVSTITSFVVLATGNSRPQNQAITAVVMDDVEEAFGILPGSSGVPEGTADSGWTILDYGSVMVHVMTPKSRLFYNVEGKWRDQGGEYMDVSDVILPNVPEDGMVSPVGGGGDTMEGLSEEEDPFWS